MSTSLGEEKPKQGIGKIFGLVAGLTILSKVAGLFRDIVILQAFGTSLVSDAWNYAFLLTGNVLVLFGGLGGPFHSSSVAILGPRKNDKDIGSLILQLFLFTFILLTAITIAAWFIAPYLIPILFPAQGHTLDNKHQLWNEILSQFHIMTPLIVIAGLVGIAYGVSNIFGKYFWPSLAPAIISITMIITILGFQNELGSLCLAVGTTIGAFGQFFVQIPELLKCPVKWRFSNKLEPGVSYYAAMLWPAAISTSIGQLTVYVDSCFTSQLKEGAWTVILNSNRLIQLPLGVLVTAMIVPILPRFVEHVAGHKIKELKADLHMALRLLWFLSLPACAILLAIPQQIVQLLFQRGHFDSQSTAWMTTALIFLAPTIFFYVARDLVTRVFYAHHDSKTPYYIGMAVIVVKALLDWALVKPLGVGGINLSTTLATVFNLTMLSILLRAKIGSLGWRQLAKPVSIMLLAACACFATASYTADFTASHIMIGHFPGLLLSVAAASAFSLTIYVLICLGLRLDEPHLVLKRLKASKLFNSKN
jgi:putative peptidoglycan lipid II flippase